MTMQNILGYPDGDGSFIELTSIEQLQNELRVATARVIELTMELHTERVQARAARNELMSVRSQMEMLRRRR